MNSKKPMNKRRIDSQPGTILIVGASSGLGRELALMFADAGWLVGICARRSEALQAIALMHPDRIVPETLDVTAPDSAERFLRFVERLGGVDVVLYAAGCGWNNIDLDEVMDDRTVATNVVGFTRIVGAAFRLFADNTPPNRRRGQIAAITSIAGTKGLGVSATYSATKRYQNTYLESLAQLARIRHVAVDITDIRPGFIDTDLLDTANRSYPMLMSVPYAARRIFKAITRRRAVAYVDWRWYAVVAGWRLIPRWLWTRLKINAGTKN